MKCYTLRIHGISHDDNLCITYISNVHKNAFALMPQLICLIKQGILMPRAHTKNTCCIICATNCTTSPSAADDGSQQDVDDVTTYHALCVSVYWRGQAYHFCIHRNANMKRTLVRFKNRSIKQNTHSAKVSLGWPPGELITTIQLHEYIAISLVIAALPPPTPTRMAGIASASALSTS